MSRAVNRVTKRVVIGHTPKFDPADWAINPSGIDALVTAGVPPIYWKFTGTHPSETVVEMTASEKTAVDDGPTNLAAEKSRRYGEIDGKTVSLIQNGGGFTHATKQFSLSDNAQRYIAGLKQAVDASLLTPPIDVTTVDDDTYTLADAAEVTAFYGAALSAVKVQLDSGRVLKKQIFDAANRAAVDAVVDNR